MLILKPLEVLLGFGNRRRCQGWLFSAVCFQPIEAFTRWIFSHLHRALHTEAESSAKRSCQGTLSRGADASGGRKVETKSENEVTKRRDVH